MKTRDIGALLLLSVIWGGSFLCMRIAAPVLGPVLLIELRVLIAGLVLLPYLLLRREPLGLRKYWWRFLLIGIINSAIPFTLIATSELHLTAGLAAILNATSPLFGAVIAALWLKETLTMRKIIGLLAGLLGVGIVMGWSPLPFSPAILWSVVASLMAAVCYGIGSVYSKVSVRGVSPIVMSTCSMFGASLFLGPFTAIAPALQTPNWQVIVAVAILAVLCTAVAYLLYYGLIERVGPTKTLTVTFLSPVFGILWGVLLLGETLNWSTLVGFGIILIGTGFVTGVRLRRPQKVTLALPPLSVAETTDASEQSC